MLYLEKKGNVTFGTTYASYAIRMDICQRNVRIGSITKEDLNKGKYKGKYKKGKWFTKGRHIRSTEMDGSSEEEEEDITESSQWNEEKVINALMKKLTKEQQINMLINMEQDF